MPKWRNPKTGQVEDLAECCRCGFCCLSVTCELAQVKYGISEHAPCPELSFDASGRATCGLVWSCGPAAVGVGCGCCIKARCYKDGRVYNFADLPADVKFHVAGLARRSRNAAVEVA